MTRTRCTSLVAAACAAAAGTASAPAGAGAASLPAGAPASAGREAAPPNLARVVATTQARTRAGTNAGRRLAVLSPLAPLGHGITQLRVVDRRVVDGRTYLRVLLAQRPNGVTGWIPADRVQTSRTRYRVLIDRRARRLTVTLGGRTVRRARVVVGAPSSPTPAGRFAISEELPGDPDDFTGRWVLPITAFSGTYREFAGGPGRIALHGRGGASLRDPLGTAASHGCVRLSNRMVSWLAEHLQPGVPVTIR